MCRLCGQLGPALVWCEPTTARAKQLAQEKKLVVLVLGLVRWVSDAGHSQTLCVTGLGYHSVATTWFSVCVCIC